MKTAVLRSPLLNERVRRFVQFDAARAQAQNAWGHVTQEQLAGPIQGQHADEEATGQTRSQSWSQDANGGFNDGVAYRYDGLGNLMDQERNANGMVSSEGYQYDVLQRLTQTRRLPGDAQHPEVSYGYSPSGNLTRKSDAGGALTYPAANTRRDGCGPHAAVSAGSNTYTCDANGNVTGGNTLTIDYDVENFARTARRAGAGGATWVHAPNGQVAYSTASTPTQNAANLGRYYGPAGYEQVGDRQIHELGPVIVTRTNGEASTDRVSAVLRDRLGSTIAVIEDNRPTHRNFDAFGAAREGDMGDRPHGTLDLNDTVHGFTQHEHDDEVYLIQTGGRLYDYAMGRFLQVDPVVGSLANSQSLNGYSYIGNNPLSGTDPTGYDCTTSQTVGSGCLKDGVNKITDDNGKTVATVVVGNTGDTVRLTDTATHMSMSVTINGAQKIDYTSILSSNMSPQSGEAMSQTSQQLGPVKTNAMLSKCVYGGTCQLPSDIMPNDLGFNEKNHINPAFFDDADAHFHAESFSTEDGSASYLAFRGTIPSNLTDWGTNFSQGLGLKTQGYEDAVRLGNAFSAGVDDSVVKTFTGHSLGGGLASLAGLVAGEHTVTFNSAGLSSGTLSRYGVSRAGADGLVDAYYLRGEILSGLQDHLPLPKAVGTRHPIDGVRSTPWSPIAKHGMDSVLGALNGGH